MKIFTETNKYKLLTGLRYLADGLFYPFFSLYLTSRNITESKIGFLLSISPLLAVILNPLYTRICKNSHNTKLTLGIISILEGFMILAISFSKSFILISIITFLMAVFGCCHYGLMDALLALYSDKTKINYSSLRVFGSATYIIATAFGGYVTELISYQLTFVISTIIFIVSGILYILLKDIESKDELTNCEKSVKKEKLSYKTLFKNPQFLIFVFIYAIYQGTVFSTDRFIPNYLYSRGLSESGYGLFYSYVVSFEVISLIVLNKLGRKIPFSLLLCFSVLGLFVRLLACYLYLPLWAVIAASSFRGISYAIVLHIFCQIVIDILGDYRATQGIMLCTLFYSVYVFIFNNVNGWIIEYANYKAFYLVNLIITGVIFILTLIGHGMYNRLPNKDFYLNNRNID